MRIAVIGATGVLGRAVIPRLIAKKHHILAISPHPEKAQARYGSSIDAVVGDLVDPDAEAHFTKLLKGFDAALNLATSIPKRSEVSKAGAWDRSDKIRIGGTPRVINASLMAGVHTYVQQSITMAYPDLGDAWITEESEVKSPDIVAMEATVRAVSKNSLHWTILRGASFIGKDTFQEDTMRALQAGQMSIGCGGQAYQSYVHVDDMAEAVVLAAEKSLVGVVLNICAEPLREGDYLKQLAQAVGAAEPLDDPKAPCSPSQRCSNQAAKDVLGWQARHSIFPSWVTHQPGRGP
jgi:nucleoside-diphosphate-sugar epimerase